MLHALIMAGGKGTRFWPLSRADKPKQLLSIAGERTMIQSTIDRIKPLVAPDRVLIITGAAHADEVKHQLPEIPPENVITEPEGRNTAPCVALAAMIVKQRDPDGIIATLPSDHVIEDPVKLRDAISGIASHIENNPGQLATIGIRPTYPETGYGYIKQGGQISKSIFKVDSFLEKPDLKTAKEYVKAGTYHWNSGMFFWKASTILDEMNEHTPELLQSMKPIEESIGSDNFEDTMSEIYPTVESISIDYAVMEKAGAQGKVVVAPAADFGWNDVGSWRSLYDLIEPNADSNRTQGEVIAIDSTGSVTHNEKRLVALIGVKDLIVVDAGDAILVCHKDRAQDVRAVTEELKKRGKEELL